MTNLILFRYVTFIFLILNVVSVHGYYVIDPTGGYDRRFDGIGGLSGGGATSRFLPDYIEPSRSQILKVEIGGGGQSTQGTEHSHMYNETDENYERGYEWWLMQEAKKHNPNIQLYGLAWSFPNWVAHGREALVNKTVPYIVNWLLGAKRLYDLNIDYVGIWNEHTPPEGHYIITLRRQILAAGLETKIIAADAVHGWDICEYVANDTDLAEAVYAFGGHYVHSLSAPICSSLNKPIFASEDFSNVRGIVFSVQNFRNTEVLTLKMVNRDGNRIKRKGHLTFSA